MKRIQRKRTKGFKMPENCKYVGRPGKWGNPFLIGELTPEQAVKRYQRCILNNTMAYYYFFELEATIQFNRFKWMRENLEQLRKYDSLACFCPLNEPCHADILIKLLSKKDYAI